MKKIYLDKNILSYLKQDKYKHILDYIKANKEFFVFPFSYAHLQDLYVSKEGGNKSFNDDIKLMDEICGDHFLNYNKETDYTYPYKATPSEVLKSDELRLDIYNSGFRAILDPIVLKKYFGNQSYAFIKEILESSISSHNDTEENRIYELFNWFIIQVKNLSSFLTDEKTEATILQSVRKDVGEKILTEIRNQDSKNVWQYIEAFSQKKVGKPMSKIIQEQLSALGHKESYTIFSAEYLTLALCNFYREKRHSLQNINSDALHAYYASSCDVLVTEDKGLRAKAEALYAKYNIRTKIIGINQLIDYMEEEIRREYDLDYIIDEVIPHYGLPSRRINDKLAYAMVPSPILGIFDFCQYVKKDRHVTAVVLLSSCRRNGYVYYSELEHFFKLVENCLSQDSIKLFRTEVVEKFLSRDPQIIATISFPVVAGDYIVIIGSNPLENVPLPKLVIYPKNV